MVANATSAIKSCNKSLVSACSKLRVESVYKTWNSVSMSTNSIISIVKLEIIKQWLKKTASLSKITKIRPHLPQSKSFLKILGILY